MTWISGSIGRVVMVILPRFPASRRDSGNPSPAWRWRASAARSLLPFREHLVEGGPPHVRRHRGRRRLVRRALAARLSEDPGRRVLLLEAGRDWRAAEAPHALRSANIIPFMHDPAHQAQWQWPGLMTRRTEAQAPKFYWRGKALGGSSAVNAQIAIRGAPAAFDAWAEAGCEGWAASDVLPLFDAIEDDAETGTAPGIRRGGPLPVHRAPPGEWGAVDLALRDAALAAGYPWKADLNAPTGE